MKNFLLVTLISLFTVNTLFAQDNLPYADKAAKLQKEIWGTPIPEFKATTVPANMSGEGAVVLARSYSLQRASNGKLKFMIITAGVTTHTLKISTFHERVKINDKVALETFSTLEYQKKLDKTANLLITKMVNTSNTYVGAKIIKPDGKEVIVNTSEEVLLRNETKNQKGKLAISGLQVGDILDYYVSNVDLSEGMEGNSYRDNDKLFLLADEYPVLYYSLDFQFNKKTSVQYIYANGAPHFEESTNEAGDLLLSLKIKNMPKYQSQFWTSALRQYPYIEIGSNFATKLENYMMNGNKGTDPNMNRFEAGKLVVERSFEEFPYFDEAEKKLKDYFKSSKALKAAPLDSVMKIFYDEWKFMVFCNYQGTELENIDDINYRSAKSGYATRIMSMMLTDLKIDHAVLLVASRNSNTLENVYNSDDFSTMIQINGDKPMYMSFDDIVTHFNEIPARFQGERAIALKTTRHNSQKYTFTESEITLPVAPNSQNQVEERLQVSLLPANMQKLKIERQVKQTGDMRHSDQKLLIPAQDIDDGYMAMVKGETLTKRLAQLPKTKKMAESYTYIFNDEKGKLNKRFSTEIKNQFDQEPEQLQDFKIINPALENTSPVFEFSASFVLNNLVKKAGNNFIIDAGKLTGSFFKLDDKDRKRNVDVYMPCARNFKYTISITIPQGYSAKGIEEMSVKKTNKTGSFTSSATISGNILTINVQRIYNNNFEKNNDWPLLTDLIDAASNFNTQKILLEKKG